MFRWISSVVSPRSQESEPEVDDRKHLTDLDDVLMSDLGIAEVEATVIDFETQREQDKEKSQNQENKKVPDYSWLVSSETKPKKYLTVQERSRLYRTCERIQASEWAKVIASFKSRVKLVTSREQIIDEFLAAAHETILNRPVPSRLKKYTRAASSMTTQTGSMDSPRVLSARSLADVSFRTLNEIV